MRKLLVFLVVLVALGVAGDRIAHKVATDEAEKRLVAEGFASPTVDAAGFPFLTQLLSRQFDDVSVTTPSLTVGGDHALDVTANAYDVEVPSTGQAVVGRLTARGTIPYDQVTRQVGGKGLRLSNAGSGKVQLRREVTVLGQTLAVVAQGRIQPRGTRLQVTPTSFALEGGGAVNARLARVLADRFTISYRLRDLPEGITIDKIVPTRSGFVVHVAGRDVPLRNVSAAGRALRSAGA
jgi:LmeA-like phospholipid-binding